MTTLKRGDRVLLQIACVVSSAYEDGSVSVTPANRLYASALSLDADDFSVISRRGPVMREGARAYSAALEETVAIVLHDPASDAYIVRRADGRIAVHPDDTDLIPEAEWRATEPAPAAPVAPPFTFADAAEILTPPPALAEQEFGPR
jgi:hypothetical protein